jgi:hypothetical protein
MPCRHGQEELPGGWPRGVTSCRGRADWVARQVGDLLTEGDVKTLLLLAFFCEWDVARRDGLEQIPELSA